MSRIGGSRDRYKFKSFADAIWAKGGRICAGKLNTGRWRNAYPKGETAWSTILIAVACSNLVLAW